MSDMRKRLRWTQEVEKIKMRGKKVVRHFPLPLLLALVGVSVDAGQPRDVDGLRDLPITSALQPFYLDSSSGLRWTASNAETGLSIPATVPGDLITDLAKAGLTGGDPLYELNFVPEGTNTTALWEQGQWNFTTSFAVPSTWLGSTTDEVLLVLDGIKMAADLSLNGFSLGFTNDQFLRYVFPVKSLLSPSSSNNNSLTVSFTPSIKDTRNNEARWAAMSGGWDWAAYSNIIVPNNNTLEEDGGSRALSKGIWKSVYLVPAPKANPVFISHVVPQVFYKGPYLTAPPQSGVGPFVVELSVFLTSTSGASGTLTIQGNWSSEAKASQSVVVPPSSSEVKFTIALPPASNVSLWWPAGLGFPQSLYQVTASFLPDAATTPAVATASRNVGFRVFALVTADDSDPSSLVNSTGSGNLTMRFKVNGLNIWSRGANLIPLDSFEGRFDAIAYRQLALSAVDAHFNVLRVWGGGIYPPESFLSACDELGLLLYHDAMYAQDGHVPPNGTSAVQEAELRHNLRRLSHHPSLVLVDFCNECMNITATPYESFVAPIVIEELPAVAPWPSCPSYGWDSGVDTLYGLPIRFDNGSMAPLVARTVPEDGSPIETHGPYQHGSGFGNFSGVNGGVGYQPFAPLIPANFSSSSSSPSPSPSPSPTPLPSFGPSVPGVFASEFGAVTMPSFESIAPTLDESHWGLHGGQPLPWCNGEWDGTCIGNSLSQRNYPQDNFIAAYYGQDLMESLINNTGHWEFQRQLYLSQLAMALHLKGDISQRRATNEWGTIVWQLSESWPTGGWGSLEYPTANDDSLTPGQVRGGRWKPLHYFYSFLYNDLFIACGVDGSCVFKNDRPLPLSLTLPAGQEKLLVNITAVKLIDGNFLPISSQPLPYPLPVGPGFGHWLCMDGSSITQGPPCASDFNRALQSVDCSAFDCVLLAEVVVASTGQVLASNLELASPPGSLVLPPNITVTAAVASQPSPGSDGRSVNITVTARNDQGKPASALFVHLTTLAQGRFSTNSFALFPPLASVTLQFVAFEAEGPVDLALLSSSLRVEHLSGYLVPPTA